MSILKESAIKKELTAKIEELKELEKLIKEAEAEVEASKDEIKDFMNERDVEEIKVGIYIVRWTSVLSNRFDSNGFKAVMPELYKQYTKQVSSRKFSIA